MIGTFRPHPNARALVKMAADRVKNVSIKTWMREDPKATWEREATELLNNENARRLMIELGKSESDLMDEAADLLALRALNAALEVAKKEATQTGKVH